MASLTPPIINPLTPLAYLPPGLAIQFEASRYLYVATLGVMTPVLLKIDYVLTLCRLSCGIGSCRYQKNIDL